MTRSRRLIFRLVLAGALIAAGWPAAAQSVTDYDRRPVLRRVVFDGDGEAMHPPLLRAQFMPGMPGMPGMMAPEVPAGNMGGMGGGMAMVMAGETTLEMMAGACSAGLLVGGVAAAVATVPAAPLSLPLIASTAAVGCGFAIAATAASIGGMAGWRALAGRFK